MSSSIHGKTVLYDHFLGAALAGEFAGVAENSGTAAIVVGQEGGVVGLTTGTTSGNRAHVSAGLNWKAESGRMVFRARVRKNTEITTCALFVGLTDTVAQEMPIELGAAQAITSNASDAVGFIWDTDATTDKWYVGGVKTDVDTALTAVELNGTHQAPVVDEYQEFVIEVNSDGDAVFYFGRNDGDGNEGVREVARIDNCVNPETLLTPIVVIETRTTAARTAYVDYVEMCGAAA